MGGEGELKLNVVRFSFGSNELRPQESETANFFRQQPIFDEAKKITKSTEEIEDVTMEVEDDGASLRDKQAYDIAARPYNISGFKVMAGSDMYKTFLAINGDDFKEGMNDSGEMVMLFNSDKSDRQLRMFSTELDTNGDEYYAIRDNDGVVHKFNKDGQRIE